MIVALGNLYYYPLKLYVFVSSYLYFRKLRVNGRQNIPRKGPLIFVINHQNALLDALLLSVLSWRNPHFLTRADIFNHPLIDKFLRGSKMLPVYRIRDGFSSLRRNDVIFESAKNILMRGGVVGLFPEGSHSLYYKIRPLKKGAARIAFMAEDAADFNMDLKIIPIGIHYESHFYTSGRTLVSFGKPIKVSDFKDAYLADNNRGYEALNREITERIKSQIIHIDASGSDYDKIEADFFRLRPHKKNLTRQLEADQQLISALQHNQEIHLSADRRTVAENILVGAVRTARAAIGFFPCKLVDYLVKKQVKDPHFIGTARFAYSIFLYPAFYLILYLFARYIIF